MTSIFYSRRSRHGRVLSLCTTSTAWVRFHRPVSESVSWRCKGALLGSIDFILRSRLDKMAGRYEIKLTCEWWFIWISHCRTAVVSGTGRSSYNQPEINVKDVEVAWLWSLAYIPATRLFWTSQFHHTLSNHHTIWYVDQKMPIHAMFLKSIWSNFLQWTSPWFAGTIFYSIYL